MISRTSSFRPSAHVVATAGEGRVFLLDTKRDRFLGLDDVGAVVWLGMEQGLTVGGIAETLASEFEVAAEQAETDVRTFLVGLEDAHLIERK